MGGRWRFALTLLVLPVGACGARTELSTGGGESPPDAAVMDAALRDSSADSLVDSAPDTRPSRVDSAVSPDGGVVPCAADRECETGTNCQADIAFLGEDLEPVPLICERFYPGAMDGALCDEAADCNRGLCVVAGSCVAPCIDDGDCGANERCTRVLARTGALSLQPYDGCVAIHDAPDDVRVSVEVLPGALRRRRSEISLDRLDTMGPTTWVIDATPDLAIAPSMLVDPTGAVLFDVGVIDFDSAPPINPVVPSAHGTFTVLVPNSSRVVPPGMRYVVTARAETTSDARVVTFGVDNRVRRRVDLDLYYVGGGDLRPSGSRGPRLVARGLSEVERLLDIEIVNVRQHAVVGGTRAALSILEETSDEELPELGELLRLSAGAARPSVDVFFVRRSGSALGVSGGIPGPGPMHGTDASGISIAVDLLRPSGLSLGRVLAHELGHHLGLFHTSERVGLVLEPIADTPECRLVSDADGDGYLSDTECSGFGADNLMFWSGDGEAISDDQRAVIHRAVVAY